LVAKVDLLGDGLLDILDVAGPSAVLVVATDIEARGVNGGDVLTIIYCSKRKIRLLGISKRARDVIISEI
jgi:hypothetical protein